MVRLSCLAFFIGLALFFLALVVFLASLRSGFMIYVDDTLGTIAGLFGFGGILSWLTSLVSGLIVVRSRPIVLLWLLPLLLLVGGFLLSAIAG